MYLLALNDIEKASKKMADTIKETLNPLGYYHARIVDIDNREEGALKLKIAAGEKVKFSNINIVILGEASSRF